MGRALIQMAWVIGELVDIGTSRQMFPWIHIDDMTGIPLLLLDRPDLSGRYNAVSPGIVSNSEFTPAFALRLGRPVVWAVPERLVRWLVGDDRSSILLRGQTVRPRRTLESGYVFRFPTVEGALADLVHAIV